MFVRKLLPGQDGVTVARELGRHGCCHGELIESITEDEVEELTSHTLSAGSAHLLVACCDLASTLARRAPIATEPRRARAALHEASGALFTR